MWILGIFFFFSCRCVAPQKEPFQIPDHEIYNVLTCTVLHVNPAVSALFTTAGATAAASPSPQLALSDGGLCVAPISVSIN